jgi:hypothetical protein
MSIKVDGVWRHGKEREYVGKIMYRFWKTRSERCDPIFA